MKIKLTEPFYPIKANSLFYCIHNLFLKQVSRLETFLNQRRAMGVLAVEDLEKLSELGFGNGGVVWKVRHRSSSLIMARKVCALLCGRNILTITCKIGISFHYHNYNN